jgi:hypothetical protein
MYCVNALYIHNNMYNVYNVHTSIVRVSRFPGVTSVLKGEDAFGGILLFLLKISGVSAGIDDDDDDGLASPTKIRLLQYSTTSTS